MKFLVPILCLVAGAEAARLDESFALVVRRSSGIAPEGTVLYCETPRNTFTNGPLRLTFPKASYVLATNVLIFGAVRVTNVQQQVQVDCSLRDARTGKVFRLDWMNHFYVCGDEFVFLSETNLVAKAADAREEPQLLSPTLPPGFAAFAGLTNTLSLAEAQARGIGIELREVLALEVEPDELGRARVMLLYSASVFRKF